MKKSAQWYYTAVKRVERLQEIEKELGREKMGEGMCWELDTLMRDVRAHELAVSKETPYNTRMIAQVLDIEVDEDLNEPEDDYIPAPSGQVKLLVNNKEVTVYVHESGEVDVEGPTLSDEEDDLLWHTMHTDKRILQSFPPDLY